MAPLLCIQMAPHWRIFVFERSWSLNHLCIKLSFIHLTDWVSIFQRTSIMYDCCCPWRKELGISDIWENSKCCYFHLLLMLLLLLVTLNNSSVAGCSIRWSSFHCFWIAIFPINSRVMMSMVSVMFLMFLHENILKE